MKKILIILYLIGIAFPPAIAQEKEDQEEEIKQEKYLEIRAYLKAQGDMMENFINNCKGVDTPKKAAKALNLMVDDMEKIVPLIKALIKKHRQFNEIVRNPPPHANPEKKRIQNLSRDMSESFDKMLGHKNDGYVKEALERLKQFQIDTRKMITDESEPE